MELYIPESVESDFQPKCNNFSSWTDHGPFGYDLVGALRPQRIVELGTYAGFSFFVFCQSVREHKLDCVCCAVDTWEGDEHTGAYNETVYEQVSEHAREHYREFTYMLRMKFDEALGQFGDESIDILHIDGLHTYEAVKHDFETWYPKVRPGGIILFHDVESRLPEFGVWRLWGELTQEYETFSFRGGYGLGVLRKPGGQASDSQLLHLLFDNDPDTARKLRRLYAFAGHFLTSRRQAEKFRQQRGHVIKAALDQQLEATGHKTKGQ